MILRRRSGPRFQNPGPAALPVGLYRRNIRREGSFRCVQGRDEDVTRVSPLKHTNLNCLGRYNFDAGPPHGGPAAPARPGDRPP